MLEKSVGPNSGEPDLARDGRMATRCREADDASLQKLSGEIVAQLVGLTFDVPADEIWAATRRRAPVARARQVAMYLAHVVCGLTLTEVGVLFRRDRTTVSHACSTVEDSRDNPEVDRCLDCLEYAIGKIFAATAICPRHKRRVTGDW